MLVGISGVGQSVGEQVLHSNALVVFNFGVLLLQTQMCAATVHKCSHASIQTCRLESLEKIQFWQHQDQHEVHDAQVLHSDGIIVLSVDILLVQFQMRAATVH